MIFRRRRDDDHQADQHHDPHDGSYDDYGPYDDEHHDDDYWDDDAIHLGSHRFESDHRRSRLTSTLGCLLPLALLGLIAGGGYYGYQRITDAIGTNTCKVRDDRFDYQWNPEQVANAATISVVGTDLLGLVPRASQIANATAIQESKLRNLRSGDRDSLGLFQQRPTMGWGTADQILDPVFASRSFYNALVKVSDWQTRPLTEVAQAVQRSGYPEAYADHETQGRVLSTAFDGSYQEAVGCRLDDPTGAGSATAIVDKLRAQAGISGAVADTKFVTFKAGSAQKAWSVAHWAVAHAQTEQVTSVIVGDRAWNRQKGKAGWSWTTATHPTGAVDTVRIEVN